MRLLLLLVVVEVCLSAAAPRTPALHDTQASGGLQLVHGLICGAVFATAARLHVLSLSLSLRGRYDAAQELTLPDAPSTEKCSLQALSRCCAAALPAASAADAALAPCATDAAACCLAAASPGALSPALTSAAGSCMSCKITIEPIRK